MGVRNVKCVPKVLSKVLKKSGGPKRWWEDNIKTEIKHTSEGCGMDSSGLGNGPVSGSCDRGNHASFPYGRGIWLRDTHNRLWKRILLYEIMLVRYCSKLSKRHFIVNSCRKAERKGRRGRRRKQLLEDRRWWNLKEEALDRTLRRSRFGRVYGFVVVQTAWFRRYHARWYKQDLGGVMYYNKRNNKIYWKLILCT